MKEIYFDHNATVPILPEIKDTIVQAMLDFGNPSSVHANGRQARQKVEEARSCIADFIGVKPTEVIFTSGGTEANNLVISGLSPDYILASATEHKSILDANSNLETLEVNQHGLIDLRLLERRLAEIKGSVLVSIMLANNETGVIQPLAEVSQIAKKYGALVHTDAVQAFGKIKVDRTRLGVDFISLSSHKIGGPQGVGALIINEKIPLMATIRGGGQERGMRAGTENVPGIVGFGAATKSVMGLQHSSGIAFLRDFLETTIKRIASDVFIFGDRVARLPNTTCISMPGVSSETQVIKFDLAGIMVSAGSACSSGKVETSHVLRGMGVTEDVASTAIRISLGTQSTESEVEHFTGIWKKMYLNEKRAIGRPLASAYAAE